MIHVGISNQLSNKNTEDLSLHLLLKTFICITSPIKLLRTVSGRDTADTE